jgi:hypothetical protein
MAGPLENGESSEQQQVAAVEPNAGSADEEQAEQPVQGEQSLGDYEEQR